MSRKVESRVTVIKDAQGIHEVGPRRFMVEASDLGLAPGEWPNLLGVDNRLWSYCSQTNIDGELLSVTYRAGQEILIVRND